LSLGVPVGMKENGRKMVTLYRKMVTLYATSLFVSTCDIVFSISKIR
jgi:hypothetical protein